MSKNLLTSLAYLLCHQTPIPWHCCSSRRHKDRICLCLLCTKTCSLQVIPSIVRLGKTAFCIWKEPRNVQVRLSYIHGSSKKKVVYANTHLGMWRMHMCISQGRYKELLFEGWAQCGSMLRGFPAVTVPPCVSEQSW